MNRPTCRAIAMRRQHSLQAHVSLEQLEERSLMSATVLVNNADTTSHDTQSETSIVLGTGGQIVVAFNNSALYGAGSSHFTGYGYSTDGGSTFTDGGKLPTSTYGDAGDPSLAVNKTTGDIYLATLSLSASNRLDFFKSTDNGQTWSAPVNSAPGFNGAHTLDKEWITVDNFAGTGNGAIYQVFTDFKGASDKGIYFNKSTDGGATWSTPISLGGSQGGDVVVGTDHSVYVFYFQAGAPEKIMMRKSTDGGKTFASAVTVATLNTTAASGGLGLGFRTNAFPQVVVNESTGDLYLVYNDKSGSDRGNIYFKSSTDGGKTWSSALKLNDDSTTNDQWQPSIAVTPDGTHVLVSWYDRRLDSANKLIDRYGVMGSISGSTITWGANGRISETSFPAAYGQDSIVNSTYMGDYDTATADNSYFYVTWADNSLSDAAHTNQPDVRFAKIAVAGTDGVPAPGNGIQVGSGTASPKASDYPPGYHGGVYIQKFNEADWIAITEERGKAEDHNPNIDQGGAAVASGATSSSASPSAANGGGTVRNVSPPKNSPPTPDALAAYWAQEYLDSLSGV